MCQYIVLPRRLSHSAAFSIKPDPVTSLWFSLHSISDHRRDQGKRYSLPIILTLAILALCCGQGSYEGMAQWVDNYQEILVNQVSWLSGSLPHGTTFYRVLSEIDVVELEEILATWISRIAPAGKGEGIALDGKSVHGCGLHLVSAFAHVAGSVLFEQGTEIKGKELVIGPLVLSRIDISGRIVTGDAMFAQRLICDQITQQKGGYVFTVKGNQSQLEQAITVAFDYPTWGSCPEVYQTLDKQKGRVEERTIEVSTDLNQDSDWPGLTHVWRVTNQVTVKDQITTQVRVGIARLLDHTNPAVQIAKLVRGHWSIENRLHRQRDVMFNEDKCGIRKRNGPHVMAALRNLVTTIFYQASVRSFAATFRRFTAKPEELVEFLGLTQIQTT